MEKFISTKYVSAASSRLLCFILLIISFLVSSIGSSVALAQVSGGDDSSEVDAIEAELSRNAKAKTVAPVIKNENKQTNQAALAELSPYSDVSILQRKYLPKTGRFQAYAGLSHIVNDPWFFGIGLNGRLSYSFTEQWAIELQYLNMSTSQRQSVKDLYNEHNVSTSSLVTLKSYMGADIVWSPIYGKMALQNERVVPFDMYFSAGMGSATVDNGSAGSALHVGTGQVYALTKATAIRWDLSLLSYSATPTDRSAQVFNNLILGAGMSWFFPEAKYR